MAKSISFDKAFIEARLNECLLIIKFQVKRGFDGLPVEFSTCSKAIDSFQNFMRHLTADNGFTSSEIIRILCRYFDLLDQLDELKSNEQNKQVSEPPTSRHLFLYSVLGQKLAPYDFLNEQKPIYTPKKFWHPRFSIGWRPSFTITKRLLSNTRPVGGLA